MKTNQKTLGVVRLVTVLLLSAMSSALLALAVISYASDPPPEQVFPNEQDFDDDGSVDDLVGDSASETEPGKLEFRSGASGQVILQYQGREGGDRFGEAAIVIGDVNWDGIPDLLVGAPREGNGAAYVFPGEVIACPVEVTVDEALLVLSPIEADFEFGFAVAALYDFDGDDTPDFRVAAKYLTPSRPSPTGRTFSQDTQANSLQRLLVRARSPHWSPMTATPTTTPMSMTTTLIA